MFSLSCAHDTTIAPGLQFGLLPVLFSARFCTVFLFGFSAVFRRKNIDKHPKTCYHKNPFCPGAFRFGFGKRAALPRAGKVRYHPRGPGQHRLPLAFKAMTVYLLTRTAPKVAFTKDFGKFSAIHCKSARECTRHSLRFLLRPAGNLLSFWQMLCFGPVRPSSGLTARGVRERFANEQAREAPARSASAGAFREPLLREALPGKPLPQESLQGNPCRRNPAVR